MKNILIVVAHPDDEVLGCFGTIAKILKNNKEASAYTLILSSGKTSRGVNGTTETDIDNLTIEMNNANNYIGIKKVYQYNFPDNAFDTVPLLDIVKVIEKVKLEICADTIFTHHIGDMNIDHQLTHKAVLTATRPMKDEIVKTVYSMEIPSSTEWNAYSKDTIFVPNVFFNIENTIDLKVEAMKFYESELREYPHPRSLKFIKDLANVNGVKVGLNYSENFMLVREVL